MQYLLLSLTLEFMMRTRIQMFLWRNVVLKNLHFPPQLTNHHCHCHFIQKIFEIPLSQKTSYVSASHIQQYAITQFTNTRTFILQLPKILLASLQNLHPRTKTIILSELVRLMKIKSCKMYSHPLIRPFPRNSQPYHFLANPAKTQYQVPTAFSNTHTLRYFSWLQFTFWIFLYADLPKARSTIPPSQNQISDKDLPPRYQISDKQILGKLHDLL